MNSHSSKKKKEKKNNKQILKIISAFCDINYTTFLYKRLVIIFKLPSVTLDAASNAEKPSLFTTFTFAPFSMSICTIFTYPMKKVNREKVNLLKFTVIDFDICVEK